MGEITEGVKQCEDAGLIDLIAKANPTKSGVRIQQNRYHRDILVFLPPERPVIVPEDVLFFWYQEHSYPVVPWGNDSQTYEKLLAKALEEKGSEFTGGYGITARTLEELESELPSVTKKLEQATGKVAFLGNGLSSVPLFLAERFRDGKLNQPPVVVDMFDYGLLEEDLEAIAGLFTDPDPSHSYNSYNIMMMRNNIHLLNEQAKAGNLLIVQHYFDDSDLLPPQLSEVDLAINCHGPLRTTLRQQLQALSVGGELLTTYGEVSYQGFRREPIFGIHGKGGGDSYTRIS